jgi:anti-anti-sigma factor
MTTRVETIAGCRVLRVAGRIDFESALDFEQSVNAMLQTSENRYIVELSDVELLSSAGLRVLLSAVKRASHRNAQFALAAPSLVVRQVFEISHFNLLFKIFPTLSDAMTALSGAQGIPIESGAPQADPVVQYKVPIEKRTDEHPVASQPAVDRSVPAIPVVPQAASEAVQPTVLPISSPVGAPPFPAKLPESVVDRIPEPPIVPARSVEQPPVKEPPTPPPIAKKSSISPAAQPPRVSPPPLPAIPPPSASAPQQNVIPPPSRREAVYPAVLEVRAEGVSYACKDGDVIGKGGQIARSFFEQIPGLEPRHLLIGQTDGRWFVFTPKTVAHPFVLDGFPLAAGERRSLVYVEHQMEFGGHVFGLRLIPERSKPGFFARLFGKR